MQLTKQNINSYWFVIGSGQLDFTSTSNLEGERGRKEERVFPFPSLMEKPNHFTELTPNE